MPGVLSGLRVVELAQEVAGPYVTKLLGDLGADVVKVEEPAGDPARAIGPFVDEEPGEDRSVLFLHLNTSKRSARLDTSTEAGKRGLIHLIDGSDLLVTDRPPARLADLGLAIDSLGSLWPSLVTLSLTPFGWDGPYRDHVAAALTTFHGAGEGYLTPVASHLMPEVVNRPPLRQGRFASEYKLATYAATLSLGAVFHARATGRGQVIDLSKQDALIGLNFFEFAGFLGTGNPPTRASLAVPFGGITKCLDGYLQFTFHEEHQWRALIRMMGDPEWAQADWAATEESRLGHADEINAHLGEYLSTRTRAEVVDAGQAMGVTVAPYHAIDEMVASPQIVERGYLQDVTHPVVGTHRYPTGPWRFAGEPPRPKPAPRLGEHTADVVNRPSATSQRAAGPGRLAGPGGPGALAGVRILDFTWAVAGPTATLQAACLGAEVIKVETSLRLDVLRRSALTGVTTNRQKRAVTLDLRHPTAVDLAKRLAAVSDVVAESFRPGVMDDLGLGYEDLRAVKDDIIMLSSSMAGQRGPYSRFAGYAPMFVALSGLGDMTGYADGPPTQIRVGGDIIVGVHGGFALLAALVHHQATGRGVHIDLSSIEAQSNLIGDSILEYTANGNVSHRQGNREPLIVPHNCFRCRGEDDWVSIAVRTDEEWQALVEAMGPPRPPGGDDPRFASAAGRDAHVVQVERLVEAWTAGLTARDVTSRLQAAGVPAAPSFRAPDLFADPHVSSRDLLVSVPAQGQEWPLVRLGGRLSATPLVLDRAGPALGEDNDEIFGSLLGLTETEIKELHADGVFT